MKRRLSHLALVGVLCSSTDRLFAQPPNAPRADPTAVPEHEAEGDVLDAKERGSQGDETRRATEEFRLGREASRSGDLSRACGHFRTSLSLTKAPGTALNLAICEEALGRALAAWHAYQVALRLLRLDDERYAIARERSTSLEGKLAVVQLQLAPAFSDAAVSLDDRSLSAADLESSLRLEPGAHVVTVRRVGHEDKSYSLPLLAGDKVSLVVEAGPLLAPAAPVEVKPIAPPPPLEESPDNTMVYVLASTSVVLVGAAGVTAWMASERTDRLKPECDGSICTTRGTEIADEGERLVIMSTLFGALGLLGTGTTVLLWLNTDSPSRSSDAGFVVRGQF